MSGSTLFRFGTLRGHTRPFAATISAVLVAASVFCHAAAPARAEDVFDWLFGSGTHATEEVAAEPVVRSVSSSALAPGQPIATGPNERLVITHGKDILELLANSAIAIDQQDNGATRIELSKGTIGVKAAKRGRDRTLSVETQYLVATVKGTMFQVSTSDEASAVSVTEGVVAVKSTASSHGVNVERGRTATVSARSPDTPQLGRTPAGGAPAAAGPQASKDETPPDTVAAVEAEDSDDDADEGSQSDDGSDDNDSGDGDFNHDRGGKSGGSDGGDSGGDSGGGSDGGGSGGSSDGGGSDGGSDSGGGSSGGGDSGDSDGGSDSDGDSGDSDGGGDGDGDGGDGDGDGGDGDDD